MYLLGIQKDHNSSVALFKNNKLLYYNQEERLTREKKKGNFPFLCINKVLQKYKKIDKVLLTGYNGDSLNLIGEYLKKINLINNIEDQTFSFFKSHHLIHAAKSFYSSGFENALIFVVDGRGSEYNLSNGELAYETSSVFFFEKPNFFKCLYKKLFTNSPLTKGVFVKSNVEYNIHYHAKPISLDEDTDIQIQNHNDIGHFYTFVSKYFGFENEEGKLMGLSAYGKYNEKFTKILNEEDFFINDIKNKNHAQIVNIKKYQEFNINPQNEKNILNLSFATQYKFEIDYIKLLDPFLKKLISKNIILTGGTALNVVNNFKIKKHLSNFNLFVEPMCGDEGNSIGVCQFYLKQLMPKIEFKKLSTLFIGEKYHLKNIDFKDLNCREVNIDDVVDLLVQGHVVALYQGRAEAGPRALGNRSLLMDPRISNGKEVMNVIKKREYFRPFACSILKEKVNEWFDMKGIEESPFMSYAVQTLPLKVQQIKSVIHLDNTCRIQTVTKKDNKVLYSLLNKFYLKTNVPILMNTSFNLAGEPLVETPQDAKKSFLNSSLKYLYFPEINKLISK